MLHKICIENFNEIFSFFRDESTVEDVQKFAVECMLKIHKYSLASAHISRSF